VLTKVQAKGQDCCVYLRFVMGWPLFIPALRSTFRCTSFPLHTTNATIYGLPERWLQRGSCCSMLGYNQRRGNLEEMFLTLSQFMRIFTVWDVE